MYELSLDEVSFPNPAIYNPEEGLIAYGGDLSIERLWLAYQLGIFPWYNPDEPILWWCPDPRFVLFPKKLKISHSMKKTMDRDEFRITEDLCFEKVMRNCQKIDRKGQEGTWITEEMVQAYVRLFQMGRAKSVEVWKDNELVGGFYGVNLGTIFCGESMFSKVSNASKAGFIYFVTRYRDVFQLIDCQVYTRHLESLGAEMIPKLDYLEYLKSL